MRKNQNNHDDFLSMWAKEDTKPEYSQQRKEQVSVSSGRATAHSSRDIRGLYTAQKRRKEIRRRRRNFIFAFAAFFVLLIVLIVLLCRGCSDENEQLKELQGCWYYNEYTEYEFDGKGNGRMFYEKNKAFEYTYIIKENIVYLDFELEYVTDCQYTYTVEEDRLILIGGKGTAEIGKEYVLTKLHEHNEE